MLVDISKSEKAMKLNPSTDKRSKEIATESLLKIQSQLEGQASAFEISAARMIELLKSSN